MSLLSLIVTLLIVGVLLWLLNTYAVGFVDGKILRIINVVVVVAVILYVLFAFLGTGRVHDIQVPRVG